LNEWITSLIRDRYHAVCDERNAYQQMQFEMTGAIDQQSTLRKMSEKERQELEKQLAQANQSYLDARAVLQNMLVIMGVSQCIYPFIFALILIFHDHGQSDHRR
jgi:multidrug resistance efflux pump